MNGTVGLVAFGVLSVGFVIGCFAICWWAHSVEARLDLFDYRTRVAKRGNVDLRGDVRLLEAVVRKQGRRLHDVEAEVADHRAFLNFIEDYTIEADTSTVDITNHHPPMSHGCDCCNPELD